MPLAITLAEFLETRQRPARIIAVCAEHAHVLFRCGHEDAKPIIAFAKQSASRRTRDIMPGSIWAEGCHVVRIKNEQHFRTTVDYIAAHADQGAAVWQHPSIVRKQTDSAK